MQHHSEQASNDLTCAQLVELVTDYLEGALSTQDRARFESHIRECDACEAYVRQMQHTINLVGRVTLTEDSINPQVRDELLGIFRTWKQSRSSDHSE